MFPPTPVRLADVAGVQHPEDDTSPGAAWLRATAARAAQVQQQLAERNDRDAVLRLHAHYAVEDPHFDPLPVAADLRVPVDLRGRTPSTRFAAEVALFDVARNLLDRLTLLDIGVRAAA